MNERRTTQPFGPFFPLIFTVAKWICRLLHPVTVQGLENLPRHGALLVANHASNWDPLVLATALPMDYRLRVMGKEELFRNPILAWAIRVGGAFPVNRGGADIQAVKTAIQTIQGGHNLLIFPEGTTIRNGIGKADGLPAHAHSGAAVIGVRTGAILVPVFVDGEKRTFHRTRIIIGQPYTPVYTGRRGTAEEMQKIADELLREVYALGGQHHPERHRQGRRPAGPRPQWRGGDRRPHRRHSGAGVRGWRKADLPPDTHHHRPALYAGIYRPPGDC